MMKLFIYEHCPFCIKARMIFGLKNIPFSLEFLKNDDEATPIKMIGQKMVPILQKEDGSYMPESMDIVKFADELSGKPIVSWKSDKNLEEWVKKAWPFVTRLCFPRFIKAGFPEFATPSAIKYFKVKKEVSLGESFESLEAKTPELIEQAEAHLLALSQMIKSPQFINGKELTQDDFHIFAILHALSLIKGIRIERNVKDYMQYMAASCKIPLYKPMQ